jgi:hypothetical protein
MPFADNFRLDDGFFRENILHSILSFGSAHVVGKLEIFCGSKFSVISEGFAPIGKLVFETT